MSFIYVFLALNLPLSSFFVRISCSTLCLFIIFKFYVRISCFMFSLFNVIKFYVRIPCYLLSTSNIIKFYVPIFFVSCFQHPHMKFSLPLASMFSISCYQVLRPNFLFHASNLLISLVSMPSIPCYQVLCPLLVPLMFPFHYQHPLLPSRYPCFGSRGAGEEHCQSACFTCINKYLKE